VPYLQGDNIAVLAKQESQKGGRWLFEQFPEISPWPMTLQDSFGTT
jgi:hypothetical protein